MWFQVHLPRKLATLKCVWEPVILPPPAAAAISLQLCLTLCNPWTVACQAPLEILQDFPRQEHWSGLPFPPLPTQGSNPCLLRLLHCRWILYHWANGEALSSILLQSPTASWHTHTESLKGMFPCVLSLHSFWNSYDRVVYRSAGNSVTFHG